MKRIVAFVATGLLVASLAAFAQDAKPRVYTLGVTGAV